MKPRLVVLATTLETRYAGLKQLGTIVPNNEIIMNYSISCINSELKKINKLTEVRLQKLNIQGIYKNEAWKN
jgi:hypothetical protein